MSSLNTGQPNLFRYITIEPFQFYNTKKVQGSTFYVKKFHGFKEYLVFMHDHFMITDKYNHAKLVNQNASNYDEAC
jgi:hypothetical protein